MVNAAWTSLRAQNNFPKGISEKHLLWALILLKQYGTEIFLAKSVGVSPKKFSSHTWLLIDELAELAIHKVSEY